MPAGRASADRQFCGSWMYQRGAIIFVGELNPFYWLTKQTIEMLGVEKTVSHILKKGWDVKTGWTKKEIERDLRQAITLCLNTKVKK
jgi:hypothetical protein